MSVGFFWLGVPDVLAPVRRTKIYFFCSNDVDMPCQPTLTADVYPLTDGRTERQSCFRPKWSHILALRISNLTLFYPSLC